MQHLCKGIYCKTLTLAQALTVATNTGQLIRRLMTGVFRPSKLLDCTVTGQSWRAGGDEQKKAVRRPLHPKAVEALVRELLCYNRLDVFEMCDPPL